MPFTHLTLGQFKSRLSGRLGDPARVFWADQELALYARETLRTWNALAEYRRARGQFSTAAAPAYDLRTLLPTLRGESLLDRDLLLDLQAALMEPLNPTAWVGSEQFTLSEISAAITARRDEFQFLTGANVEVVTQNVGVAPPIGRVPLASDRKIDIRRAAWRSLAGARTHLYRIDEFQATALNPYWSYTAATPESYSVVSTEQTLVQLIPVPQDTGTLELWQVRAGLQSDPAVGVALGIPDDWVWVVKWGALASLLRRDGPGRDLARADYCEARWRAGVEAARMAGIVIGTEVQGRPLQRSSLWDLDTLDPLWQDRTGEPDAVGLVGHNLVAANTQSVGYSVTVDVIARMPVPALDADLIEVGREHVETLVDYAVHLASFKLEGPEFAQTQSAVTALYEAAAAHNSRLRAATFFPELERGARAEETKRPRAKEAEG